MTVMLEDDEGVPCVSCCKPSNTSTPDDAAMCWECFGEFNAACYDELKSTVDAQRAADDKTIKELSKALEKMCEDFKIRADHVYRKSLTDHASRIKQA